MAKIVGNVVGLPNPQPDWNQTNKTKADYIKNKPRIGYEADLQWGGENLSGKTSPIDAALLDVLSSNRFAFMPPEYVVIEEYGDSSDGTSVWKTRALAGHYKTSLTTDETRIGMSNTFTSGGNTYNVSKIRVTFTVPKGSMYMAIKKLMIKFGTGGHINTPCTVSVAKYSAPNEFSDVSTCTLNGDPSWNVIQLNGILFGGFNSSPDTHITSIRLTFEQVGDGYSNISLQSIYAIAPDCWMPLNPMQKRGTPYVVLKDGTTVFYANNKEGGTTYAPIQASEFRGVATRAIADENGNNIANTYMKKSDAPSSGVVSLLKATMVSASIDESMLYKVDGIYTVVVTLVLPHIYLSEHIKPTVVCIQPAEGNYYENTKSAIENGLKARKELINYGPMDGRTSYFLDIYSPNPFTGTLSFDVYYTVE